MEEMQRRFRDELDSMKQLWSGRLGMQGAAPKYSFARLAPFQRIARTATGRNPTRVEVLYEHLQEELGALSSQLADGEQLLVLFGTGPGDVIQVGNIGYRNPDLLVIEGLDEANQRTRILAQAGAAQLVVKVVKADPDTAKPTTDFQFSGNLGGS